MDLTVIVPVVVVVILAVAAFSLARRVRCPQCGTQPPTFRLPTNARQTMWGGWTCRNCGTEFDRKGQKIDKPA